MDFDMGKFDISETDLEGYGTLSYDMGSFGLGEEFGVVPFGDIHRDSDECDVRRWHEFLEWAGEHKNYHFLGMGDYVDYLSRNERASRNASVRHSSTRSTDDREQLKWCQTIAKEMQPMKGRIICFLEGNHYWQFNGCGASTGQILAHMMGAPYLGNLAYIRCHLGRKSGQTRAHHTYFDIFAHHGTSSGRANSISSVERLHRILPTASFYLMGHDHRKGAAPFDAQFPKEAGKKGSRKIRMQWLKQYFCRTGSFQRGYIPGKNTFVSDRLMTPANLGVIKITMNLRRARGVGREGDRAYLDYHVSV